MSTKAVYLLLLSACAMTLGQAVPQHRQRINARQYYHQQQHRLRFLPARHSLTEVLQEQVAVTPYPTAAELKPEVAFNEVATGVKEMTLTPEPEQLGPAFDVDDKIALPVPTVTQQPDLIYGPPTIHDIDAVANDDPSISEQEPNNEEEEHLNQLERLLLFRRLSRPVKLRAVRTAKDLQKHQQQQAKMALQQQESFAAHPLFYYSAASGIAAEYPSLDW